MTVFNCHSDLLLSFLVITIEANYDFNSILAHCTCSLLSAAYKVQIEVVGNRGSVGQIMTASLTECNCQEEPQIMMNQKDST